ncbi:hypothetical protein HGRIS_002648 [Hohenbuehelia grisea]|uniref:Uncharacterized protein n=2 Tax=Hohenbuehelia grisea TaxID=104357 RepID=A0ABR3JM24_9AGAR
MPTTNDAFNPALHGLLPDELVQTVNQTYLLQLLAVEPAKVLPPGKSLLAMMTNATNNVDGLARSNKPALQGRVEDIIKQAFWDEAAESLSDPLPSVQLTRLKHFHADMLQTLNPLFPKGHAILLSLSSPLPPTSSPLQYSVVFLKEILLALRERCAPVRDQEIDECIQRLESPLPLATDPPTSPHSKPTDEDGKTTSRHISPIAQRVTDTIKSILLVAEEMKSDLDQFTPGNMTEVQLRDIIMLQAKQRERETVAALWRAKLWDEVSMKRLWDDWAAEPIQAHLDVELSRHETSGALSRNRWVLRLLQSLGSPTPVSCNSPLSLPQSTVPPSSQQSAGEQPAYQEPSNSLPPQLFFSSPALFHIQNLLQALVISAALRSLTRLPPSPDGAHELMQRVWTLLRSEIDEPDTGPSATKLVHLADEVIRARRMAATTEHSPTPSGQHATIPPLEDEEERRIRAAVERTLQFSDPVLGLLQKRLLSSMAKALVDLVSTSPATQAQSTRSRAHDGFAGGSSQNDHVGNQASSVHGYAPVRMKTGRGRPLSSGNDSENERPGKRNKLFPTNEFTGSGSLAWDVSMSRDVAALSHIKGFEEKVLVEAIDEVFSKLKRCISWVQWVWDIDN